MRAIAYKKYGKAEVLEEMDLPDPVMGEDDLLVRIHAVSVNPIDWKIRSGALRLLSGGNFPRIPGSDFAGEVLSTGKNTRRFQKGDRVFGMLPPMKGGAFATLAAVPERLAAQAPRNLTYEECAAVPLAGLTALQALRDPGEIQDSQKVLIYGAAGGVGTFAIQIARIFQADVTAVASGSSEEIVRSAGANRFIDYTRENFARIDSKYDIVFDCVGKTYYADCVDILKPDGKYITVELGPGVFWDSLRGGFFGGPTCSFIITKESSDDLDMLRHYIQGKTIKPVISTIFPLSRAREAHALSEAGHVKGKIVLRM
ncbi:MAG TPA: NAD(P)-dependent alcohol dehydrogenase [Leptospiraceae bacterium]|jgi:NADPH:quinone reductase-like Zn-dependent oxidoreductase|nr:NAD(P)-dependent alcohol dehydrogenase [Leptospirales bacterium]HMU82987.1 NAD(P)-dependent alcohol dehydrogenase [Leptospiraceae bacterium]HMX58599.1 NAD(P)-dependent alcohol dehydrogenase [Leptospiraceae bacterium]HMZ35025.1 NAD(P)-dependent alcohol dehydrogenase [Leptospiraceae bacterium]HNE24743.1 NAD(P)-dependent alcohol dehydrogenase [Leptospiraceae bacterium]